MNVYSDKSTKFTHDQKQSSGGILPKKFFLKISQYSQENALLRSLFNKIEGLKAFKFIKHRFRHRFFTANIAKFLRITFSVEHLCWMLFHDSKELFQLQLHSVQLKRYFMKRPQNLQIHTFL